MPRRGDSMAERLTPEEIRAWAEKSRAASGVPPKIEDEATLVRLARLAFADAEDAGERGDDDPLGVDL
jgi:hypothetical protein